MGSWGLGSGDSDNACDLYPTKIDDAGEMIPPTSDELNAALRRYLKKGKLTNPFKKEEFIGAILLGLSDKVYAHEEFIKLAYISTNELLIDLEYLKHWSDSAGRTKALEKERKAILKLLTHEKSRMPKLTSGLLEAQKEFDPKTKAKKKKNEKIKRPSPSSSATQFKVGTRKKGNDGNMWIVTKASNQVLRWAKVQS